MGHFTKEGRPRRILRPVASEWLVLNGQIGKLANQWSHRNDLLAYIGPDGGRGQAAAIYDPISKEIEINIPTAFGDVSPAMIEDFSIRKTQLRWAKATGAVYHEAMHAMFTTLEMCKSGQVLPPHVNHWFDLLEETRIEHNGVQLIPANRIFLKSCALGIVLADSIEETKELSNTRTAVHLAILSLGRVDAGVLSHKDVKNIRAEVLKIVPLTALKPMRKLWKEFQTLDGDEDFERMCEIAHEFAKLVEELAEANGDPKPGTDEDGQIVYVGGSGGEEGGDDDGTKGGMFAAVDADRVGTEFDANDEIEGEEAKARADEAAKKREEAQKDADANRSQAEKMFTNSRSNGPAGRTRSKLKSTRQPSPEERSVANQIAQALRRAKYRDRIVTERDRNVPPGRLNTSAAIQGIAARKNGGNAYAEPFRDKSRHHVEDPNLAVGIMCDISGSMGRAMEPIAVSSWIMSAAVQRIHGQAAAVYYGESAFSVLKPGEFLREVTVYTAEDWSEQFDPAFRALDGGLNLLNGSGARLLVICSDGQYGGAGQMEACIKWLNLCRERGVAVVWLDFKDAHDAKMICEETGATRVVTGAKVTEAAAIIGEACKRALEGASR